MTQVAIQLVSEEEFENMTYSSSEKETWRHINGWQRRLFKITVNGEPDARIQAVNLQSQGGLHMQLGFFKCQEFL